jgi:hypothetical protein
MSGDSWLVSEERPVTQSDLDQTVREAASLFTDEVTRGTTLPRLSVKIRNVVCRDVHKWFGGAEIRLDALAVHGNANAEDVSSVYSPGTFRFPDIHDNQPFPLDPDFGMVIFDGKPAFFLDIFVMASRDRKDSDDLASLLKERLNKDEFKAAAATLLALAAVPTSAAVAAAIGAAAMVGDLTYQVVKAVSPKTIGMYRGSFLQFRDGFGVGRHPEGTGQQFLNGDLQFWFETVVNEDILSSASRSI